MKDKAQKIIYRSVFPAIILAACLDPGDVWSRVQIFSGKAINENGGLEYVEKHEIVYSGPKAVKSRTIYYSPDDQVIGTLVSEYDPKPGLSDYTFKDFRNGYEDGARLLSDRICLFQTADQKREESCLPRDQKQIVGQGFHHFILNNLESIARGSVFHVKLVLPSRLDEFEFRIKKMEEKGSHVFIRLEIDNWFLRLITPHVDVVYDRERSRLLSYQGVSNLANASGEYAPVRIEYTY